MNRKKVLSKRNKKGGAEERDQTNRELLKKMGFIPQKIEDHVEKLKTNNLDLTDASINDLENVGFKKGPLKHVVNYRSRDLRDPGAREIYEEQARLKDLFLTLEIDRTEAIFVSWNMAQNRGITMDTLHTVGEKDLETAGVSKGNIKKIRDHFNQKTNTTHSVPEIQWENMSQRLFKPNPYHN